MHNPTSVLENNTRSPMGFSHPNGSLNLGQTTRPNQQQKKIAKLGLCCSGLPQCRLVVFSSPCFAFTSLICVAPRFVVCVPKKYYYYYYTSCMFFEAAFAKNLSPESPLDCRTSFSILSAVNNVVVWLVSNHPLISKSSNPLSNNWGTVPSAPITKSIMVPLKFLKFLSSLAMTNIEEDE